MITKDYFEKQLKKHSKITMYSPENIKLTITKEPYINMDDNGKSHFHFEMDCEDITDYCKHLGLYLNPTNNK